MSSSKAGSSHTKSKDPLKLRRGQRRNKLVIVDHADPTEASSSALTEENLEKLPSRWTNQPPESPELHKALSSALKRSGKLSSTSESRNAPDSNFSQDTFIAKKIRGLINSIPAFSSRFLSPTTNNASTIVDSNGRPIPPPGAARIQDPELISLLSNPSIMSGSDGRRQSVWSMLDAIEPPRVSDAGTMDQSQSEYAVSDRSSIMMYSPLIPNADSVIELAALEDFPTISEDPTPARWSWPVWPTFWPFGDWTAKSPDFVISESPPEPDEPPAGVVQERKEVPVQRVWKPSTTKLSFETTWWGYRLYLPPPVLSILDDQSVEATRQATTITAALTWFFTNLPISTFPPPLQSAMFLLQRLVPFISYIGTFISWSWSTIRGFDRGHGVILTATWLLPIALIPSTWHARDVPPPLSPASPMPIPSITILPAEEVEELSMSIPVIVHPLPLPPTPPPEPENGASPGPSSTYTSRSRRKDKDKDKEKESESKLKAKSYKSTLRKLKRTLT